MSERNRSAARDEMVRTQIMARGVRDDRVLDAMRRVPREAFVPPHLIERAFEDRALPLACEQSISQPFVVGTMIEALRVEAGDRILEVGTGSGYAAAVLSELATEVVTVERHADLAESARTRLHALGCGNVHVLQGDGSLGHPARAPYDAILVSAAAPEAPPALLEQLRDGGRLVIPIGATRHAQDVIRLVKRPGLGPRRERLCPVRFVPLLGAEGWDEATGREA